MQNVIQNNDPFGRHLLSRDLSYLVHFEQGGQDL